MYARWLAVLVIPCALTASALCGGRAEGDAKKLQGTWSLTGGEDQGKPVPAEKLQGNLVVIAKGTIIANDKDHKKLYVMTYKLDPSRKPHAIDMTIAEGRDKGKTAKGIYELQGDNLKLCYSIGGDRPATFSTKAGDKHLCFAMKRFKP